MLHHHVLEAPLVPSPYLLRFLNEQDDQMRCIDLLFILSCHTFLEPSPRGFPYLLSGFPHFKEMKLLFKGFSSLPWATIGAFFFTMGYNRGFHF